VLPSDCPFLVSAAASLHHVCLAMTLNIYAFFRKWDCQLLGDCLQMFKFLLASLDFMA